MAQLYGLNKPFDVLDADPHLYRERDESVDH